MSSLIQLYRAVFPPVSTLSTLQTPKKGARAVRDRTGGRAAVHGVPTNVARSADVLPNAQTTLRRKMQNICTT